MGFEPKTHRDHHCVIANRIRLGDEGSWVQISSGARISRVSSGFNCNIISFKVHMKRFFSSSFERAFKVMKNGVYFTMIALLVAELFKIVILIQRLKSEVSSLKKCYLLLLLVQWV